MFKGMITIQSDRSCTSQDRVCGLFFTCCICLFQSMFHLMPPLVQLFPTGLFSGSRLRISTDTWDLRHDMNSLSHWYYHFLHSVLGLCLHHCYFHVYSLGLIRLVGIYCLKCLILNLCSLDYTHHNTLDCDYDM